MRFSLRAATAVAMPAGFYVLLLGLAAGILVGEGLLLWNRPLTGLFLAVFAFSAFFALVGAVITIGRAQREDPVGVPVTAHDQPRLWDLVNRVAAVVGTRPPDEVRIVPVVNAAVSEQTRLLGLRVVRRRLYIGAPLLACLTEEQIASILAHELGHYGNRDTRLAGIVMSGRDAQLRVLKGLKGDNQARAVVAALIAEYTKLYLKVSSAVCRGQELAADVVSARVAGSVTAASALRELLVLGAAWDVFVERHLAVASAAGYLPNGVFDGFADLLGCDELADFLEEVRQGSGDREQDPYDSHPPTSERIAAVEALAAQPVRSWGGGPAAGLLVEPTRVLDASFASPTPVVRVDWAELGHLTVRARTAFAADRLLRAASRISGRPATLTAVLDALDAGRLVDLAPDGLRPGSASGGPRARREFARGFVEEDLTGLISLAHVDAGRARWRRDWIGDVEYVGVPPEHVDAAVADGGSTTALRAALAAAGIAPDYRPTA
ncbi:M48 family metallopeptidase [Umezawaea endophytica]|uniref:M48 family metallopeptidase n=1 Tax=Umezawaea endophytica TaxID=1654476 RepID=A0A9X2VRX1_9PSEU|nr:M48 family metallopeptidase [Umezawaea endophytica]MCS7481773.1 M48 family metallopeptidase [Umezawaea endophytica]